MLSLFLISSSDIPLIINASFTISSDGENLLISSNNSLDECTSVTRYSPVVISDTEIPSMLLMYTTHMM